MPPSDFSAVDPVMPKEYLMPPPGGVVVAGGVVVGGVVVGGVVPPPLTVIVARVLACPASCVQGASMVPSGVMPVTEPSALRGVTSRFRSPTVIFAWPGRVNVSDGVLPAALMSSSPDAGMFVLSSVIGTLTARSRLGAATVAAASMSNAPVGCPVFTVVGRSVLITTFSDCEPTSGSVQW